MSITHFTHFWGSNPSYSENFDVIRTLDDRRRKMIAVKLQHTPLYRILNSTKQVLSCYDNVEFPIYIGGGQTGKWMRRGDLLPDHVDTSTAMGYWNNRYIAVPHSIDYIDQWENEGNPQALFRLVEFAEWEASLSMYRAISVGLMNGIGGAEPDGLMRILEKASPSSQVNTIGGIDKSTKSWWRNQYVQLTSDFGYVAPGTTIPAGILAYQQLVRQCTVGQLVPTHTITRQEIFENFRRAILEMGLATYNMQSQINADVGVSSFMFEGQEMTWDANVPQDTVIVLHIGDRYQPGRQGNSDTKISSDFEAVPKKSWIQLNGGIFMIKNPNVNKRRISPRSGFRDLSETGWIVDSVNLGVDRISDHGVAGSDTGNRWGTW